jgi:hypothetical protein
VDAAAPKPTIELGRVVGDADGLVNAGILRAARRDAGFWASAFF